jgi:ribonuclease Z
MAIEHSVLGQPGRDNALLVCVDSGQSRSLLLFDCGDDCLRNCAIRDIQSIEAVFFSHFHIDHIAGFDTFLRCNYARADRPVSIFGPSDTRDVIGHRLRGVTWNLVGSVPGEFRVSSIDDHSVTTDSFLTREGFAQAHRIAEGPFQKTIVSNDVFEVEAMILDHGTPSIGYVVREKPRVNVDLTALNTLGFAPGPWLKLVKDPSIPDDRQVDIRGSKLPLGQIRRQVLIESPGASIAYLTDFSLDAAMEQKLVEWIAGCQTLVCENNFRNCDRELAAASRHLVAEDVARVAARANVGGLVVLHISDRYTESEWLEQLAEVRSVFPGARFPEGWKFDGASCQTPL